MQYYRSALKIATGQEVDPLLVEEFVKSEMAEDGDEASFSEKREELVRRGSGMSNMLRSSEDEKADEEIQYLPALKHA